MSDQGIAIELSVPGFDKSMQQLQAIAAQLDKLKTQASSAAKAVVPGTGAGASANTITRVATVNLYATSVLLHGNMQMVQNNVQINTWNQANQQVNSFSGGLKKTLPYVGAAIVAIDQLTKATIGAGAAMAQIGITSGGTQAENAQLKTLGGVTGTDMAALSREFAARIASDGMAAAFANRAGIHDFGALDPQLDKATNLLKAAQYIMQASDAEATRFARLTGTESLLRLRLLSEKSRQNLLENDPRLSGRIMDEKFQRDMVEVQYGFERVALAFGNLASAILKPSGGDLAATLNEWADNINKFALSLNSHANQVKGWTEIVIGTIEMIATAGNKGSNLFDQGVKDIKKVNDPLRRAIDNNTRAVQQNTDQYATQNGTYGGGDRARSAIPSKWAGVNATRYVGEAARLGAFNL